MKKVLIIPVIFVLVGMLFMGCSKQNPISSETPPATAEKDLNLLAPKDIPNGAHYNLNIIGVPNDKTAEMDDNMGHRIFVKLDGKSKILLMEGDPFQVLDANGTDGNGAKFQLPNPDPDNDGVTVYSVYARALGKPGGKVDMTTGATDPGEDGIFGTADDIIVFSVDTLKVGREKGKPKWDNVSNELLYIYVDLDEDGVPERYNLFNEALQDYFWEYDNRGLKLLQLRFYEVPTDVTV
ncbi:hypothetical protein JXQ31_14040 [candidate division KSB1 bacterium]|nr:hypothetical protein [candidate division KSB1 bacterium]